MSDQTIREVLVGRVVGLVRYANTLSPHKLKEPLDPVAKGAIDDWTDEVATALNAYVEEREIKARLGMLEYYDQVPKNEDMNWKGLFADNRQGLEYELRKLKEQQ